MIFIFPLAPVCIAVAILGMSFADGLLGSLSTIRNIVMVLEVVIAVIIFISNIKSLRRGDVSGLQIFLNSVSGAVAILVTDVFFKGLASNGGGAIEGPLNLIIGLLFAGPIWFCMISGWLGTCAAEDNWEMWKSFLMAVGGAAVLVYIICLS